MTPPPISPPPEVLRARKKLSSAVERVSALAGEVQAQEDLREAALRRQEELAAGEGGNVDSALINEGAKANAAESAAQIARIKLKAAARKATESAAELRRAEEAYAEQYDREYETKIVNPRRERVISLQAQFMEARRELQAARFHSTPHIFAGYHPDSVAAEEEGRLRRVLARAEK